jgi:hypothetical protein
MLEGRGSVWGVEKKDPVGQAIQILVTARNG